MSSAARSLFVFGIYVALVGAAFVALPGRATALLGLPDLHAGWGRTVGLLAFVIAAYDMTGAWFELKPYLRASVWVRYGFAAGITVLVLASQMPAAALPLGMIDFAGATWTALALRGAASRTA